MLDETDRLLSCSFCRTRLYLVPDGHFSYYIPPPPETNGDLFYIPYWRLRGSSFTITATGVRNRFVDMNVLGTTLPSLPASLGLRPQVLKLRFVTPSTNGRFVEADRHVEKAIPDLCKTAHGILYRGYIGETVSLIHTPLILRNETFYDGILGRPIFTSNIEECERIQTSPAEQRIRFIPTLCPHCGWDMEGERDSLVLFCRNCNSAWACPKNAYTRVPFVVMTPPGTPGNSVYLPFWRMKPRFKGLDLSTYADLIRFANLPKAITPEIETLPLVFWAPAFKVNPALYTRWSRQMTVFRPFGDEDDHLPQAPLYPVTLPLGEAVEGVAITLAHTVSDKRKYRLLAGLGITLDESRLEYHPFIPNRNELLHTTMRVAINRTALQHGIKL